MATFDVNLLFSGLAFFCLHGNCEVNGSAEINSVYLVEAVRPTTICNIKLHGGHRPELHVDADDVVDFDDELTYTLNSRSDLILILPLDTSVNKGWCFADDSTKKILAGTPTYTTDVDPGDPRFPLRSHSLGWSANLREIRNIDPKTRKEILRNEVEGSYPNAYVSSKIKLPNSRLNGVEFLTCQGDGTDRGQAFKWKWDGAVKRELSGRIAASFTHSGRLLFGECDTSGTMSTILLKMEPYDGILDLSISNLPPHPDMAGADFLWYQRLLPTQASCEKPTDPETCIDFGSLGINTGCIPSI